MPDRELLALLQQLDAKGAEAEDAAAELNVAMADLLKAVNALHGAMVRAIDIVTERSLLAHRAHKRLRSMKD